ncbi:hypothetical protein [Novipirellula sp.]|uniref:hypothetical protein n=1 Tax=Novipirellula sp. TaxID=2795430 RepID=UPI00356A1E2D
MQDKPLTERQLSTLFKTAWKHRGKVESEPEHAYVSKTANWFARMVTLEAELARQAKANRLTVNQRIAFALQDDKTKLDWSKREWAEHLRCSESAVQKTEMWAAMMRMREQSRLEHGKTMTDIVYHDDAGLE